MDELHIVGHTADRCYLIVARADDGSRFSLPVDSELVTLVEDLTGEPLGNGPAGADDEAIGGDEADPPEADPPEADASGAGPDGLAGLGVVVADPPVPAQQGQGRVESARAGDADEAANGSVSRLPPREIQARLRAGHSVGSVAKAAGTSTERIQPWLRAVEGEREQVLAAWRTARLSRSRLGPSHDLLGDAVRLNLRAKGVDPDAATWKVRRTDGQAYWTVELRYTSRGRTQRALYRYYPERAEVEPRNEVAEKIGWTRGTASHETPAASEPLTAAARRMGTPGGKKTTARNGGKKAAKKAPGKKAATKKAATKKAAAKKAATKKTEAKKAGTKKAAAKKAGTKKTGTKKAPAKKTAGNKTATTNWANRGADQSR